MDSILIRCGYGQLETLNMDVHMKTPVMDSPLPRSCKGCKLPAVALAWRFPQYSRGRVLGTLGINRMNEVLEYST